MNVYYGTHIFKNTLIFIYDRERRKLLYLEGGYNVTEAYLDVVSDNHGDGFDRQDIEFSSASDLYEGALIEAVFEQWDGYDR